MKINRFFILFLTAVSCAWAADDQPLPSITVINQYGSPIELQIVKRELGGKGYSYTNIPASGQYVIKEVAKITNLGIKALDRTSGAVSAAGSLIWGKGATSGDYQNVDISDLKNHSGKSLLITISAGLGGWGSWHINKTWIKPSENPLSEEDFVLVPTDAEEFVDSLKKVFQANLGHAEKYAQAYQLTKDFLGKVSQFDSSKKKAMKNVYLKLLLQYHPDKNPAADRENAEAVTKALTQAVTEEKQEGFNW